MFTQAKLLRTQESLMAQIRNCPQVIKHQTDVFMVFLLHTYPFYGNFYCTHI